VHESILTRGTQQRNRCLYFFNAVNKPVTSSCTSNKHSFVSESVMQKTRHANLF